MAVISDKLAAMRPKDYRALALELRRQGNLASVRGSLKALAEKAGPPDMRADWAVRLAVQLLARFAVERHNDRTLLDMPSLRARGWTDAAVRNFLGEADDLRDNPKYRHAGAPMKLYFRVRVEAAEATPAWTAWKDGSAVRKSAARAAVATKEAELAEAIEEWSPTIRVWERDKVVKAAIDAYNAWNEGREKYATEHSDPQFLERITVNFIRHELTEYDFKFRGRVGITSQHEDVRDKVLEKIAELYPWLEDECWRQI